MGVINDLKRSTEIGVRVSRSRSKGTGTCPYSLIILIMSGMLIAEQMISLPFGKFLAYELDLYYTYLEVEVECSPHTEGH